MPDHTMLRRTPLFFSMFFGLMVTLLVSCSSAPTSALSPELVSLAAPATENEQGLLVVDATAFQANQPKGKHSWQLQKDAEATGGTAMAALRDLHVTLDRQIEKTSPRLDYRVQFVKAGTHYVWVHGQAAAQQSRNGDSLHIGLNGRVASSAKRITGFTQHYDWVNQTMARRVATLKIPKPGVYTLNVWMREDGTQFDALALTTDVRFVPSDALLAAKPEAAPEAPEAPAAPTDAPPSHAVPARAADAFVDSVGVNTHLHYTDTVYNRFSDLIKPKLLALGVRHIRDGAYTYKGVSGKSFYYSRLGELAAKGIRFDLLTNIKTRNGEETNFLLLDDIYAWTDGAVESFEGVNEPDIQSGTTNWVEQTRAAQKTLYDTVRGNPVLKQVKVIGPSPVWKADALGNLSSEMDYGNSHTYTGGAMPMVSGYGSLKFNLDKAALNSRADPVVVTETGYHNAVNTQNGHRPVSEEIAAVYIPRLLLSYFDKGIVRTYLYEFINAFSDSTLTNREAAFGLLRNDGSEKPVYRAVQTLLRLLEDPGSAFQPGSLHYELSGNTRGVQQVLLQKRDGTFYLALWIEASGWDRDARRELRVSDQQLSLKVGQPVGQVTRYTFGGNGQAVPTSLTLQAGQLELSLSDKLTLLELSPVR